MKMCDIKMTIPWSMVIILTILTVNAEAQADSETSLDTAERRTATAQNGNGIILLSFKLCKCRPIHYLEIKHDK